MFPRPLSSSVFTTDRREWLWDTFIFNVRFYVRILSVLRKQVLYRQRERHCMDDLILNTEIFFLLRSCQTVSTTDCGKSRMGKLIRQCRQVSFCKFPSIMPQTSSIKRYWLNVIYLWGGGKTVFLFFFRGFGKKSPHLTEGNEGLNMQGLCTIVRKSLKKQWFKNFNWFVWQKWL